ncbi:MAG: hypothetical protein ACKOC5_05720 [Chloroflexota bacterium]
MAPFSQRLEIAFWQGWVAVLQSLRSTRWASLLLVVSACSGMLLLMAFSAAYLENGMPAAAQAAQAALPKPQTGQHNLLLVLVDRLEPAPQLGGAWLVVADPEYTRLTFLPLGHTIDLQETPVAADLARSFGLTASGELAPAFIAAAEQTGIWWDNYLVVDASSLSALVDLVGGVDLGGGPVSGAAAAASLRRQTGDPAAMLDSQAVLMDGICRQAPGLIERADPQMMAGLLAGYGRTDIPAESISSALPALRQLGGLSCQFPTLIGR